MFSFRSNFFLFRPCFLFVLHSLPYYLLYTLFLHFITRQNVRKIDLPLLISNFKCNAERAFLLFLFLVKQRRQLSILRINPSCQTGPDRRILLSLYSTREIFALSVTNDENVSLLRISPDRIDFAVSRPKDRHKGVKETGWEGETESWTLACNFEPDAYNFAFISRRTRRDEVRRGSPIAEGEGGVRGRGVDDNRSREQKKRE